MGQRQARHVAELVRFQPDGPYLLGGWSAGSTIALEMARQLRMAGREVALLVALDGAPLNTGAETARVNPLYAWKLMSNVPFWVMDDLLASGSAKRLSRRAWNKAAAIVRKSGRVAENAVAEFIDTRSYPEHEIRFMNSLLGALRRYVPVPYPGPVVVYQARAEPLTHLF
jgi:thioesterase domain-containing protein